MRSTRRTRLDSSTFRREFDLTNLAAAARNEIISSLTPGHPAAQLVKLRSQQHESLVNRVIWWAHRACHHDSAQKLVSRSRAATPTATPRLNDACQQSSLSMACPTSSMRRGSPTGRFRLGKSWRSPTPITTLRARARPPAYCCHPRLRRFLWCRDGNNPNTSNNAYSSDRERSFHAMVNSAWRGQLETGFLR